MCTLRLTLSVDHGVRPYDDGQETGRYVHAGSHIMTRGDPANIHATPLPWFSTEHTLPTPTFVLRQATYSVPHIRLYEDVLWII